MKQNSPFQARMTWIYTLFSSLWAKQRFRLNNYSMQETWPVLYAMKLNSTFQARKTENTSRFFIQNTVKCIWPERYLLFQARMTWNLHLQALKPKYALHRNMKHSIREICLVLKAWSKTAHFKRGWPDLYSLLPDISTKRRLTQKNRKQLT